MITRRHFLAALSALPFVGKLVPQETHLLTFSDANYQRVCDEWVPMTVTPSEGGGEIFITNGDQGYVFKHDDYIEREFKKWQYRHRHFYSNSDPSAFPIPPAAPSD